MPTLVITNDFPPRIGGIEAFVATCCELLDEDVVVLTSRTPGRGVEERAFDGERPYPVVRAGTVLLPTPATLSRARRLIRDHGCRRVLYGSAAPLGALARPLERDVETQVALTHGHETWWARLPATRRLLRDVGDHVDHVTANSAFVAAQIAPALGSRGAARLVALPPPLDTGLFAPAEPPTPGPVVLAAGRLVRRKGFDVLLRAWPAVLTAHPGARLVIVGDGPDRPRLERLRAALGARSSTVELRGAVPRAELPSLYRQASVFALPVRTRLGGLEPEGFGYVFAEAAACGLPVVVGRSGGAPETCVDGETGIVVDGRSPTEVATAVSALLADPARAAAMGRRGRAFVEERYGLAGARATLRAALAVGD